MPTNRDFWLKPFSKNHIPNWNCPSCSQGILRPIANSFRYDESKESYKENEDLRISYLNYHGKMPSDGLIITGLFSDFRFTLLLRCNNHSCREHVAVCGSGNVVEDYDISQGEEVEIDVFIPEYFYPAINIFSVSEKCPEKIITEIKSSFKLFFADPSASANYVRKAVDAILTNKNIKRLTVNKNGKKVPVNLHSRIIEFEKSKPDIAKKLLAIKWLGNEGSHTDKITKNDVLDAYEILEMVIDDLYVGHRKLVEKKIAKINKTKKPLHPST